MKAHKRAHVICGICCIILALLLAGVAVFGHVLGSGGGKAAYQSAMTAKNRIDSVNRSASKTAPSAVKKASAAVSAAQSASDDVKKAQTQLEKLISEYDTASTGDALTDTALRMSDTAEASAPSDDDALTALTDAARQQLLDKSKSVYDTAHKSVQSAQGKLKTAADGVISAYDDAGLTAPELGIDKPEKHTVTSPADALDALETLAAYAVSLENETRRVALEADGIASKAAELSREAKLPFKDTIVYTVGTFPIGFAFTALLCLAAGLILLLCPDRFVYLWKNKPLFSTLIALIIMMVIQIYALGFKYASYADWGGNWLINALNVLRSNSSVGMIALGMTFVIITGGIDLAVGSNLAGVATVVMVCLDISKGGFLTGAGITGTPNYLIAIGAGLLCGALLGLISGLGITKGRIPPFIFTLGIMNIVRSAAQYFTKGYKPEVPKEFQILANREIIGGQMLLPIIYWLILAAIMYVISEHTAFGRHIYAVGSNERASRLSGINVDRTKLAVYILMGVIVAVAAITSVARLRGVDVASAGSGYEMNAIAAVVVGGTSMAGGRGKILGTVFGVLIIGIMNNLLVLVGIDAFLTDAFTGAIIIFAVLIQKKEAR